MVTTSSNTYWAPLKPRVRIYALSDTAYATPIFSYDGFSGVTGATDKILALNFETNVSNVGQASIAIEDSDHTLDVNDFVKGQRLFIEGSKDNVTWQPAFKGVVRSATQEALGETGRNLTITAYNYLIRLGERIVKVNKESSKTGSVYNQTDSTMFTDNLINNILTDNNNYVYNTNEISGAVLGAANITSSPVTTWVPKLDVEFNTLQSAIDEVLDYSGGILAMNFADDELILYHPDEVTGQSAQIFRVTNVVNKSADDVLNTMYPLEPYTYSISYDTDESASRLILPFKHPDTAPKGTHKENSADQINATAANFPFPKYLYDFGKIWQAVSFEMRPSGDPGLFRIVFKTLGNCSSFASNSTRLWIYNHSVSTNRPTIPISGPMILYPRAADGSFPTGGVGYPSSPTSFLTLGMRDGDFVGELLSDQTYWVVVESTAPQSNTNRLIHVQEVNGTTTHSFSGDGTTWSAGGASTPIRMWNVPFKDQATPEINLDWIVTANDRNAQKRLGYVERTVTSIPNHIDGLQTIQHYLYPRINIASKPRFNFDYPSLTMPNKIPKAGDMLCHMDTTLDVGTSTTAVQTSVITSARYDFGQDSEGVMGLRKLGLSTAGLRRGHY
jgi:hypothetical protein